MSPQEHPPNLEEPHNEPKFPSGATHERPIPPRLAIWRKSDGEAEVTAIGSYEMDSDKYWLVRTAAGHTIGVAAEDVSLSDELAAGDLGVQLNAGVASDPSLAPTREITPVPAEPEPRAEELNEDITELQPTPDKPEKSSSNAEKPDFVKLRDFNTDPRLIIKLKEKIEEKFADQIHQHGYSTGFMGVDDIFEHLQAQGLEVQENGDFTPEGMELLLDMSVMLDLSHSTLEGLKSASVDREPPMDIKEPNDRQAEDLAPQKDAQDFEQHQPSSTTPEPSIWSIRIPLDTQELKYRVDRIFRWAHQESKPRIDVLIQGFHELASYRSSDKQKIAEEKVKKRFRRLRRVAAAMLIAELQRRYLNEPEDDQ